jgi:hypothetical protein
MLPKTSVIGAPSMRMRVGSLIDRMASTATPSRVDDLQRVACGAGERDQRSRDEIPRACEAEAAWAAP